MRAMTSGTTSCHSRLRPFLLAACLSCFVFGAARATNVPGGTISVDTTWNLAGSPYIVQGTIIISGTNGPDGVTTLTIEPGVEVRFVTGAFLRVGNSFRSGALRANGDAPGTPATIKFTSNAAVKARGDWGGIDLTIYSHASTLLRNVLIEYAGRTQVGSVGGLVIGTPVNVAIPIDKVTVRDSAVAGMRISNGNSVVTACRVESNTGYDLDIQGGAGSVSNCSAIASLNHAQSTDYHTTVSSSTFPNWGQRVSSVHASRFAEFQAGGNTLQKIPDAHVAVSGFLTTDAAWDTSAGIIDSNGIFVEGTDGPDGVTTLTIAPGTVLRFSAGNALVLGSQSGGGNPGRLIADGSSSGSAAITFASQAGTPSPGGWRGIEFAVSGADGSVIRNAVIESAEYGVSLRAQPSGRHQLLEDLTIRSCTVGAHVDSSSSTFTINRGTFASNQSWDVEVFSGVGTISNSSGIEKVYYTNVTPRINWIGNTFNNWGVIKSRIAPGDVESLTTGGNVVQPADGHFEVVSGTLNRDNRWGANAGTIEVPADLFVNGTDGPDGVTTLSIGAGTKVEFGSLVYLRIGGGRPGRLIIDGDDGNPTARVLLQPKSSVNPSTGWAGITFDTSAAAGSIIRNTEIARARTAVSITGRPGESVLLDRVLIHDSSSYGVFADGNFAVRQSEFRDNTGYDLWLKSGAGRVESSSLESIRYETQDAIVDWVGNHFTSWGEKRSIIAPDAVSSLSTQNQFDGVPGATVEVLSGWQFKDQRWAPAIGAYQLQGLLQVYGTDGADGVTTMTLLPGTVLKLGTDVGLEIGFGGEAGRLETEGTTPATPALLTSVFAQPQPGDWRGVSIGPAARLAVSDLRIEYAQTGLTVRGNAQTLTRPVFNRCPVGLEIIGANFASPIVGLRTIQAGTAVSSTSSSPILRDCYFEGSEYGVNNHTAGIELDAANNYWGAPDGPSGAGPGHGSAVSTHVTFQPYQPELADDGDGIPKSTYGVNCTGGQTTQCDDNCRNVANRSQSDVDADGVGDACDELPTVVVSNNPSDISDFDRIQAATDAVPVTPFRIKILRGSGRYYESVRLDRGAPLALIGVADGAGNTPEIDGGSAPAIIASLPAPAQLWSVENVTVHGSSGIQSFFGGTMSRVTVGSVPATGIKLDSGLFRLDQIVIANAPTLGIDVGGNADVTATRMHIDGATDTGMLVAGQAKVVNTLLAHGKDGVRMTGSGTLQLDYSTIAAQTGLGIDNAGGGSVVINRSIVADNVGGDLRGVACGLVSWSDIESVDCSAQNNNLFGDPQLAANLAPMSGSLALDHGPPPESFSGLVVTDLMGDVRVRDFDGDGFARSDCGAFEQTNAALVPAEVEGLVWSNTDTLTWTATTAAVRYHAYRDDISSITYQHFATCRDDLDANPLDTVWNDFEVPSPGTGLSYLVSAESASGREGTLGFARGIERSNFTPCP